MNRDAAALAAKLIADAVFTYARVEDRSIFIEQRFIEVDRATLSVERLVAELARYGQLERAREKSGKPLWGDYYRIFPPVICALTVPRASRSIGGSTSRLACLPTTPRSTGPTG